MLCWFCSKERMWVASGRQQSVFWLRKRPFFIGKSFYCWHLALLAATAAATDESLSLSTHDGACCQLKSCYCCCCGNNWCLDLLCHCHSARVSSDSMRGKLDVAASPLLICNFCLTTTRGGLEP